MRLHLSVVVDANTASCVWCMWVFPPLFFKSHFGVKSSDVMRRVANTTHKYLSCFLKSRWRGETTLEKVCQKRRFCLSVAAGGVF